MIFSAAHYHAFTTAGYAFDWYTFSFRFAAGLFFAGLFVARGFGIAVGAKEANRQALTAAAQPATAATESAVSYKGYVAIGAGIGFAIAVLGGALAPRQVPQR